MASDVVSVHSLTSTVHRSVEAGFKTEKGVDPYLVQFDDNDPLDPKNMSVARKWYLTAIAALLVLNCTFASATPSYIIPQLQEQFGFSEEIGTLTISLFVCGYIVGPLLWGPLSETYGRRPVFVGSFFVYMCFQIGCALAPNTAAILVFRFLGGTFAAAPLANSGAVLSDIWDAKTRGNAMTLFTVAPFAGPGVGPVVAGYIAVAGISWRWLFWIMSIFAGICWLVIVFTVPETYAPVILTQKAKALRKSTGDNQYYSFMETRVLTFRERFETILARPFVILFHEPMLIAITVYISFVYGCLYLLFEAYPIVFTEGHHMNPGVSGLMFLPLPIGGVLAVILYIIFINPRYAKKVEEYAPAPVPPEARLEIALVAAPFFAISFFWFAWTSYPSVSFWAPMMSGVLVGLSICWIFLSLLNYIIDAYLVAAASALSANTIVRSCFGAGFPLFATQMYDKLGPEWASTLLGCLATIMIPIPFVLMKYGTRLRANSKFAPSGPPRVALAPTNLSA